MPYFCRGCPPACLPVRTWICKPRNSRPDKVEVLNGGGGVQRASECPLGRRALQDAAEPQHRSAPCHRCILCLGLAGQASSITPGAGSPACHPPRGQQSSSALFNFATTCGTLPLPLRRWASAAAAGWSSEQAERSLQGRRAAAAGSPRCRSCRESFCGPLSAWRCWVSPARPMPIRRNCRWCWGKDLAPARSRTAHARPGCPCRRGPRPADNRRAAAAPAGAGGRGAACSRDARASTAAAALATTAAATASPHR